MRFALRWKPYYVAREIPKAMGMEQTQKAKGIQGIKVMSIRSARAH
jgi:hypothetical protein